MSETPEERSAGGLAAVIELAVLINLVNPGTLHEFPTAPSIGSGNPETDHWHRFIDALAWLADVRKGGKSVTAICGVEIADQPRLLLASNYGVKKAVANHIHSVLRILQNLADSKTQGHAAVSEAILSLSIGVSHEKVLNYSKRLSRLIQKLVEDPERSHLKQSSSLYQNLAGFESLKNHHLALCSWAYKYSKSGDFIWLNEMCSRKPKIPLYHQIRHYIGRLGSWHRAVSVLVLAATEIPDILTDLDIEVAAPQLTAWRPADEEPRLRNLIERLNLDLNTDQVLEKLQKFYSGTPQGQKEQSKNLQQAFTARLRDPSFRPTIHAEVLLVDYIFAGKLKFINNDRYIGCSKPACVLCRLYLETHPAQVTVPRCHGNLWPQWSPPLLVPGTNSNSTTRLVRSIMERLKTLLLARFVYGQTGSQRLPDSVTGITIITRTDATNIHTRSSI